MRAPTHIVLVAALAGCSPKQSDDFVQGPIRIVPPVERVGPDAAYADGGTRRFVVKDATGMTFDIYVDNRLGTKTPGAIYLFAYPRERQSVRVENQSDFSEKVRF